MIHLKDILSNLQEIATENLVAIENLNVDQPFVWRVAHLVLSRSQFILFVSMKKKSGRRRVPLLACPAVLCR